MNIKKIGVVGAGTMGSGIAQVAATSGFDVILHDVAEEYLARALKTIDKSLAKLAEKGKIAESKETILGRIKGTTGLEDFKDAEFVVEAVFEDFEIKKKVLTALDKILPPEILLTSNTSSISITRLAALTGRPSKFMGMHFMNPVPMMTLVELIKGIATAPETFAAVKVLMPMINEAVYALMEGVGTVEAIDTVMKLGMNHPMGPLALADLIGLDVCLYIMEVLYEGFKDTKYRPCPLLRKMVDARYLGRKSGRGFYEYNK
jgi:3-hydroxybutyryl-CoA dehydrogenase